MSLAIEFGKRIKESRLSMGLTLDQLAARAELSKTGCWELENGASMPGIDTALKLAKSLGVRVGFLIEGIPDKQWQDRIKAIELTEELLELLRRQAATKP
jgi:transcriptional regulator with XRE-family HTH domain